MIPSSISTQKMISYSASPDHYFMLRTGAVIIHEEHVLLMRSLKRKRWFLPGGRNEFFEGIEGALHREILEELQCTIQIERLLWIHEYFMIFLEKRTHQIAFYFLATITSEKDPLTGFPKVPKNIIDGDAELEIAWIPLKDLPYLRDDEITPFLKTGLLNLPPHPLYQFDPSGITKESSSIV